MYYNVYNKLRLLFALALFSISVTGQQPPEQTAEELFNNGLRLMKENRHEEALAALRRSAELAPENAGAFGNIGAVNMSLRRPADAEAAFRKAIALDNEFGEFYSGLCLALTAQKKFTDALKACEDGVRLAPESAFARRAQIEAEAANGKDGRRLMSLVDLALAKFRNDETLLAMGADISISTRNYRYALELLQRLVSIDPDQARYHGRLAEVQLRLGEDAGALASARRALSLEISNPYANFAMGLIFFELGANEEAADSFGRVPPGIRFLEEASYYQAISEKRRGRFLKAIALLKPLVKEFPNDVRYASEYARNLYDANRYKEANAAYLRASELDPKDPVLLAGLGLSYMASADFENAVRVFDICLELRPGDETFEMFARVARFRQTLPGKIDQMIKDVESSPTDVQSRVSLVSALLFLKRNEIALKYVEEVYALDPPDPKIYQYIGVAFTEGDMDDKALDAHRRSLAKGEYEGAYLGIAGILSKRGEIEAAAAAYEKVIEIKPNVPNIMIIYANMLRDNGKRREALAIYQRSLALQPSNAIAIFNAGVLSLKLGQPESAKIYLESLRPLDSRMASQLERCIKLNIWG